MPRGGRRRALERVEELEEPEPPARPRAGARLGRPVAVQAPAAVTGGDESDEEEESEDEAPGRRGVKRPADNAQA